jgi:hypothetical protein
MLSNYPLKSAHRCLVSLERDAADQNSCRERSRNNVLCKSEELVPNPDTRQRNLRLLYRPHAPVAARQIIPYLCWS